MDAQNDKPKIKEFTDLFTWQKGHTLVIAVYGITKTLPENEKYGLVSQMQRASVSVTSNIAEGFGRRSLKEKLQFYFIAHGSLTEVKNLSLILRDTQLVSYETFEKLSDKINEAQATLLGLLRSTKNL
jgi:four helix bundle protein